MTHGSSTLDRFPTWPSRTIDLTVDAERDALRQRQAFLQHEHAVLLDQSIRLAGSNDSHALHAHTLRLTQHHEELLAFAEALESFHHRYGPLDWKPTEP